MKIEPYSPCPCGSGKKFKFCCYLKKDEMPAESGSNLFTASSFFEEESGRHCVSEDDENFLKFTEALRCMKESDFDAAISLFREVAASGRIFYAPVNNLAICLFATGRMEEAIQVQSTSIKDSLPPNPFGLSNLATFYYVKGDLIKSRRFLEKAVQADMPSEDSTVKVCEVLARFKLHQNILDFADSTRYADAPNLCFYTGVAAANLGQRERACHDLAKVPIGHHKASMARRYLNHLRKNTAPHTLRGDWPYLILREICPFDANKQSSDSELEAWTNRPVLVDVCEAMLNERVDDFEDALEILAQIKHPDAAGLLWTIVKGRYGPDRLRLKALNALQMNEQLAGAGKSIEVFLEGGIKEISVTCTKLNPEFRFGETLPPVLDKQFSRAVTIMRRKKPDWDAAGRMLLKVLQMQPDYYPAKYNYAITLVKRGRIEEAETLLQEIVVSHPEYLFARGTLIQLMLHSDQIDEIEELINSVPEIEETHPEAMVVWLTGQALYHEQMKNYDKADALVQSAHDIAPDLPTVQSLRKRRKL